MNTLRSKIYIYIYIYICRILLICMWILLINNSYSYSRWRIRVLARIRAFRKRSNLRSVKSIFFLQGKNYHIFIQFFFKLLEQVLRCIMISDIESFFNNFFSKKCPNPERTRIYMLFGRIRPNSGFSETQHTRIRYLVYSN